MTTPPHFLGEPEMTVAAEDMFQQDLADSGFVMNLSRLWAHGPDLHHGVVSLIGAAARAAGLDFRQRGFLVTATAAALGDSYCSLAWGTRLAGATDEATAAKVINGGDTGSDTADRALVRWARRVVSDPSGTREDDVAELRAAGFSDEQIFAVTVFVAMRVAFSTVNDALGALPDAAYRELAPSAVRAAVTYGRPMA